MGDGHGDEFDAYPIQDNQVSSDNNIFKKFFWILISGISMLTALLLWIFAIFVAVAGEFIFGIR